MIPGAASVSYTHIDVYKRQLSVLSVIGDDSDEVVVDIQTAVEATQKREMCIRDRCNGKVYLSPVMALYNREIVSYSISLNPSLYQIKAMLNDLFDKLPDTARPIFHSDQGWQYQHKEYQRLLAEHSAKYVSERDLYGQWCNGKLLCQIKG